MNTSHIQWDSQFFFSTFTETCLKSNLTETGFEQIVILKVVRKMNSFVLTCYVQFSSRAKDPVSSHSDTDQYKNLSDVECGSWGKAVSFTDQT